MNQIFCTPFYFQVHFKITKWNELFGFKVPETDCWKQFTLNVASSSFLAYLTEISQAFVFVRDIKLDWLRILLNVFFSLNHVVQLIRASSSDPIQVGKYFWKPDNQSEFQFHERNLAKMLSACSDICTVQNQRGKNEILLKMS